MDVLALLPPLLLSHLRVVLAQGHHVMAVRTWHALHEAARRTAVDVVVIDPLGDSPLRLAEILSLRERQPSLPVVVYTQFQPAVMRTMVELGRCGVEHVVLHHYDDEPRRLIDLLERLPGYTLADRLLERMEPELEVFPSPLRRAIERMYRSPARFRSVSDLASAAGMTLRMLYRRFEDASHLSPMILVQSARVLRAYTYLRDDRVSVLDVAMKLAYSSHRILTHQMQELVGMTPAAARTALSPEGFIERLVRRLLAGADDSRTPFGAPVETTMPEPFLEREA